MGKFVNPDNSVFQRALNSQIYIDKTGLIAEMNKVLYTEQCCVCNSRPRRFGKSVTANMLAAYYSKGCDSAQMFADLEISKDDSFKMHLNKYDVIHLDVQWCCMDAGSAEKTVDYINEHIVSELREIYPDILTDYMGTAYGAMSKIYAAAGSKFVVIIDEWDVLIRDEAANQHVQDEYITFLRGMFKGTEPTKFILLAYLTGILPIKKIRTQSALNNFDEFTMLEPDIFAPYIGFTEEEVRKLCDQYGRDFQEVKRWYDGYLLGAYQVYNPKAVISVMTRGFFRSYWTQTGTYESIIPLINMDFDGLRTAVIEMIAGAVCHVDTRTFQNDMVSFKDKDDVLTLLIHLGYLAYDAEKQIAYIPNEEIRQEFMAATKRNKWNELLEFEMASELLLNSTLDMDAEAVAEGIEKIHMDYVSAIQYNNENSLGSVLSLAYLSAMQYYFKPVREMPAGRGFADYVFIPKPEYRNDYPALMVELKWNMSAETALAQIRDKRYPESLLEYSGRILLVGINYDKKTKAHQCVIEEYKK